jgi:AcrR family transcriptional regulator
LIVAAIRKTSATRILAAAKKLVHKGGVEALTMQAVAGLVRIRAPSLYKHFADRAALIQAVRLEAAVQMRDAYSAAAKFGDPRRDLHAMARAQRTFSHDSPHLYALVMSASPGYDLSAKENEQLLAPLLELVRRFGDPRRLVESARLLVSFVHGFSQMEAAGAFRLGGDIDASFEFGLNSVLDAISRA